jgi:hypothetical protein
VFLCQFAFSSGLSFVSRLRFMNRLVNTLNTRLVFLAGLRSCALLKPHRRWTTPNTCSTRARIFALLRFLWPLALSTFGLRLQARPFLKSLALAAWLLSTPYGWRRRCRPTWVARCRVADLQTNRGVILIRNKNSIHNSVPSMLSCG